MPHISKESHDKIVDRLNNKITQAEKLHEFQCNQLIAQVQELRAIFFEVRNLSTRKGIDFRQEVERLFAELESDDTPKPKDTTFVKEDLSTISTRS